MLSFYLLSLRCVADNTSGLSFSGPEGEGSACDEH